MFFLSGVAFVAVHVAVVSDVGSNERERSGINRESGWDEVFAMPEDAAVARVLVFGVPHVLERVDLILSVEVILARPFGDLGAFDGALW